eukprot:scaffold117198_cov34-Prasinocladus_malaysianus.AAC.2
MGRRGRKQGREVVGKRPCDEKGIVRIEAGELLREIERQHRVNQCMAESASWPYHIGAQTSAICMAPSSAVVTMR